MTRLTLLHGPLCGGRVHLSKVWACLLCVMYMDSTGLPESQSSKRDICAKVHSSMSIIVE
jgi:hypothetical protein